jgi:hypothetical protein
MAGVPQGRGHHGPVPAAQAGPDAGPLLPRHVHPPRKAAAAGQVRSVTLLNEGRRLYAEITAEVPVATYPAGQEPDTGRVAGVDPGVIHPFAVAGPDGQGLLVSGRAIRAAGPGTRSRSGSRTAGPGTTSQMSPRLDVTRGAALITAVRQGPLAGRGPPHPEVGTSLAYRPSRNARIA